MFYSTLLTLLPFLCNLWLSSAHPQRNLRTPSSTVDCTKYPPIISYHTHIVFALTNQDQINQAENLRNEALVAFADLLGPQPACEGTIYDDSGRYDNGRFCMIYDHPINETLNGGPFPVGEWSMFVPVHYYGVVSSWFIQHRGNLSLLVHPNTGCEYEDHVDWAQWSGEKWVLDTSIFKQHVQTNEFYQFPGSPQNPVCLTKSGVCGSSDGTSAKNYAPQVACCSGLACNCGNNGVCSCN